MIMSLSSVDSIFKCAVRTFCRTLRLTVLENASVRVGKRMTAKRFNCSLQPARSSILLSFSDFFRDDDAVDGSGTIDISKASSIYEFKSCGTPGNNSQMTFKV